MDNKALNETKRCRIVSSNYIVAVVVAEGKARERKGKRSNGKEQSGAKRKGKGNGKVSVVLRTTRNPDPQPSVG